MGRAGNGDPEFVPGNSRWLRLENITWSCFRFSVGTSNACAMLQLTSRPNSSASPVFAASAPGMGNDENRSGGTSGPATSVITKVKPKTKRPNLYRVLILNDDYTPMEFVVHVLEKFFQKDVEAAIHLRDRRDQGDAGDGFRAQAPASPAMRDGKEVK